MNLKTLAVSLFESHGVMLWQYDPQAERYKSLRNTDHRFADFLQTQEAPEQRESKCRSQCGPHLLIVRPDILGP